MSVLCSVPPVDFEPEAWSVLAELQAGCFQPERHCSLLLGHRARQQVESSLQDHQRVAKFPVSPLLRSFRQLLIRHQTQMAERYSEHHPGRQLSREHVDGSQRPPLPDC